MNNTAPSIAPWPSSLTADIRAEVEHREVLGSLGVRVVVVEARVAAELAVLLQGLEKVVVEVDGKRGAEVARVDDGDGGLVRQMPQEGSRLQRLLDFGR